MAVEYLTMKQTFAVWEQHFNSPKSSSALTELARRRSEAYHVDCMPKKRGGLLTVSREQLDNLIANVQECPTGRGGPALTVKAARRFGWRPPAKPSPPPHREPWSWTENVYNVAKRNWAAAQKGINDRD